jgi:hypothetical protein
VPSESRPQPPYAESLPVQVKEGLVMATAVEEPAASTQPAATVVEARVVTETTAPHTASEP